MHPTACGPSHTTPSVQPVESVPSDDGQSRGPLDDSYGQSTLFSKRHHQSCTKLTPKRWRPTTTPRSGSCGSRRSRHSGHSRAIMTCSVTSTRATGSSITSRVRCTQPPDRPVPHSEHDSEACTTCRVGSLGVGPTTDAGKAVGTPLAWLVHLRLTALGSLGLVARHPGRWAARYTALQVLDPSPERNDHRLLLGNDPQQRRSARLPKVYFSVHLSVMSQLPPSCLPLSCPLFQLINSEQLLYRQRLSLLQPPCHNVAVLHTCNAGLSPMHLFGATTWREGCLTPARCSGHCHACSPNDERLAPHASWPSPPLRLADLRSIYNIQMTRDRRHFHPLMWPS